MIKDAFDKSEVLGDVLDQAVYDVSGLANANHNMDKLYVAIEIAKRI